MSCFRDSLPPQYVGMACAGGALLGELGVGVDFNDDYAVKNISC